MDGFRLGPLAPTHQAVVDGDTKSAAIAAASIVAKVVRDRAMRRFDALFPHYGFASHVGYITPRHSAAVRERGPSVQHRRSFQALCYERELEAISGLTRSAERAAPLPPARLPDPRGERLGGRERARPRRRAAATAWSSAR